MKLAKKIGLVTMMLAGVLLIISALLFFIKKFSKNKSENEADLTFEE